MERVRAWFPPPHEAEHVVHSVYEFSTQSMGQLCVSQLCVSARKGHTSPPCIGVFSIFERVRVWLPLPQLRVHDVHVDQALTEQSTGHGPLVQACDLRELPHAAPPFAG
jgi:hypothetical protein